MDFLTFMGHVCILYCMSFVTYLWYDKLFGKQPAYFLEMWLYLESKFEELRKQLDDEQKELIKKITYSFFNSEERSFENFKAELKRWKDENKDKK